jgi:broad specificity phosphatase PhoE
MTRPDQLAQLYLVRHGQTTWNKERKLQGATDIPLDEEGRKQAHNIRKTLGLERIDRVVSSPLSRAYETAEIIASQYNVGVAIEHGLKERSYGEYEGQLTSSFDEVRRILATLPPDLRRVYQHKDEETEAIVLDRLIASLKGIAQSSLGQIVVAVSHGSAMGMLLRTQFGSGGMESPHLTNTAFLHIASDGDTLTLKQMHGVKDRYE